MWAGRDALFDKLPHTGPKKSLSKSEEGLVATHMTANGGGMEQVEEWVTQAFGDDDKNKRG